MSNGETGLRVQREVGDARGLRARALVETMMIGRRAGEVAGAIRHRRAQDILQGGRLTKEGNGKGAPALVGVVVTWETGDEKVAGSQRPWTLRRILEC